MSWKHQVAIEVERKTSADLMRRACEMTMPTGLSAAKMSIPRMAQMEHSPLRTVMYWIELRNIPTFVSVHLVRHKVGVEHFVRTNREDLYDNGEAPPADRWTPVNHGMWINLHSIMHLMHARLCHKASKETVWVATQIRAALIDEFPDLRQVLVPKCVYRQGYCNEHRSCDAGPKKISAMYARK